jgi:microcystin-dependent protein
VVINGELLPFIGGLAAPYVYVETSNGTELFGDLTNRPVYETKAARLTSLVGGFPMTGFRRYKSDAIDLNDSQVVASSKSVKSAVDYLLPLTMPVGGIIMWSGLIVDIPTGWALCDGSGGTPNLSGRFIVGYDSTNPDYDTIGEMGGAAVVTLGINEIPAHTHGAVTREPNTGGGSFAIGNAGTTGSATTGSAGGSLPHENRPPYYTLAYIIKL